MLREIKKIFCFHKFKYKNWTSGDWSVKIKTCAKCNLELQQVISRPPAQIVTLYCTEDKESTHDR